MIYTARAGSPGVGPGEEYETLDGMGVPLPDRPGVADALLIQVEITGASG
jgi:hypothetical protein